MVMEIIITFLIEIWTEIHAMGEIKINKACQSILEQILNETFQKLEEDENF